MREVRRSALVPYSPMQMYALVNDVRRYPEFLPWCPATRVHEETQFTITATVDMQRAGVRFAITTRNTMQPGERLFVPIRATGSDDQPAEVRGCRVELLVTFEFRSATLGLVLGPLFESTWNSLVDAFVRRAREVYHDGP